MPKRNGTSPGAVPSLFTINMCMAGSILRACARLRAKSLNVDQRRMGRKPKMKFKEKIMQSVWARLMVLSLVLLALLLLPSRVLAQETVTVPLDAVDGSSVTGTATLRAANGGTDASLALEGLPPNAAARATLQAGTCAQPSASTAIVADFQADAAGMATATGAVRFRGTEPVSLATVADGAHVILIQTEQVVACGVIPALTPAANPPEQLPVTGGASPSPFPTILGILGLSATGASLLWWRRNRSLHQR
jgi:LPXTG-motif cell wall-anchored protein